MRFFLRAVTCTSALLLCLSMLVVNMAFELTGSVPDIDGCGFLAGSLLVLLFLYPALAAFVTGRAARYIVVRAPADPETLARMGAGIGLVGAGVYFIAGILGVLSAPHTRGVALLGWLAGLALTGLCAATGRIGAQLALNRMLREGAAAGERAR